MRIMIPPSKEAPLECSSEPAARTPIPCVNQTNVELETFGFHHGERLKVIATGYAKIHAHAAVTDRPIVG